MSNSCSSDQLLCRMGLKLCLLPMKGLKVEKVRIQGFWVISQFQDKGSNSRFQKTTPQGAVFCSILWSSNRNRKSRRIKWMGYQRDNKWIWNSRCRILTI